MRTAIESLWTSKGLGAWLLSPLAGLYRLGWTTYLGIYKLGLKKAYVPTVPVVVVGNLTAGGSGKTPVVIALAEGLQARGVKVVLGASGYGSPAQHEAQVAPEGPLNAAEWGDEPTLLRHRLPAVPMIVGRDRVAAAKLAEAHFPDHLLLMDDGFQHLRLKPGASLLIEPDLPNDFCFPAGPYREPKSLGHPRATAIIRYGKDVHRQPLSFVGIDGRPVGAPSEAIALCAIAHPSRFLASLREAGVSIRHEAIYTDHDPLSHAGLWDTLPAGLPVVVTEKDFVKLRARPDLGVREVVVARLSVRIDNLDALMDQLLAAARPSHS